MNSQLPEKMIPRIWRYRVIYCNTCGSKLNKLNSRQPCYWIFSLDLDGGTVNWYVLGHSFHVRRNAMGVKVSCSSVDLCLVTDFDWLFFVINCKLFYFCTFSLSFLPAGSCVQMMETARMLLAIVETSLYDNGCDDAIQPPQVVPL